MATKDTDETNASAAVEKTDLKDPLWSVTLHRKRSSDNFSERIQKKERAVLKIATEAFRGIGDHSFDSNWEIIAWGIDVIQQMLDTPLEKRGKMAAQRFQLSLNGLVTSMANSSTGSQLLLEKLKVIYDDYLEKVVQPAIQSKEGTEKLKEIVFRWENHKIFCEYMRRMFLGIDKNSCHAIFGGEEITVSAMGLRKFKKIIWGKVENDIVGTMLALIRDHRKTGKIDEDTRGIVMHCKKILCVMGVVSAKDFHKIAGFVDPIKANKGDFRFMERLEVIGNMGQQQSATLDFARSDDLETYIEVDNHIEVYTSKFEGPFLRDSKNFF